jgi:hypothetical protein
MLKQVQKNQAGILKVWKKERDDERQALEE